MRAKIERGPQPRPREASAVEVRVDPASPTGHTIRFLDRRELTPDETIYRVFDPPRRGDGSRTLVLYGDWGISAVVDLSRPLAETGRALFAFDCPLVREAVLRQGGIVRRLFLAGRDQLVGRPADDPHSTWATREPRVLA